MEHATFERIEGLISASAIKLDEYDLFEPAVVLPGNAVIKSIEHLMERPVSMRGDFQTSAMCSFHAYIDANRDDDTVVFVDRDAMAAVAVMDHACKVNDSLLPGWGRHKAVMQPKMTPEYAALLANSRVKGKTFSQRDMADWINDWKHCLTFYERDGDGEKDMPSGRAIQAVQKIDVKKMANASNEEGNFNARRTRMEEIEIGGEIKLPERMVMKCEPYVGFGVRDFSCRFIAFWDEQRVSLGYRIDGLEHVTDEISAEFEAKVTKHKSMEGVPVFLGTFARDK